MEDPDDTTMVYDYNFGFNEAGMETVYSKALLQMPVNTQVRQEENGTILSRKGRLGNGQSCYLTAGVNMIAASN